MANYIVKIVKIDFFGVEEAKLQFEINGNRYWAFSYPCDFKEGETAEVEISPLCIDGTGDDSFLTANADKKKELIQEEDGRTKWSYHAYGEVVSIFPVMADCGDMLFDLGNQTLAGKTDYIYFFIDRLDINRA